MTLAIGGGDPFFLLVVHLLRGCVWYVFFSSVFAITERRDMGLYKVPLSMCLLGFGVGTMLANCHMCGIMLVLRAVFNMLVRNPRGPMCFRCLVQCCMSVSAVL